MADITAGFLVVFLFSRLLRITIFKYAPQFEKIYLSAILAFILPLLISLLSIIGLEKALYMFLLPSLLLLVLDMMMGAIKAQKRAAIKRNKRYVVFNPNSISAPEGPIEMVLCRQHAKRFFRGLRRKAQVLYRSKGKRTNQNCEWCEDPLEFEG